MLTDFKKNALVLLACFVIAQSVIGQEVFLNEIVSNSDGFFADEDGDHSDWVEIYNPSAEPIQLEGYSLTDDSADLGKWSFPDAVLNPNEYMVVFCSDKNRYTEPLHTNFKLKSSGESLILSNSSGEIIDQLNPTPMAEGFALAKICTDDCYFQLLNFQSPEEDNLAHSLITFSMPSGVFENDIEITLSNPLSHEIRYTLDGSTPTADSPLYQEPLILSDASESEVEISNISTSPYWSQPTGDILQINTLRARSFVAGIPTSQVFSRTYAVGEDAVELFAEYPVFSFQSDADSLFDPEYGIHVPGVNYNAADMVWSGNYFQRGPAWERNVHIEFFENAQPQWSQNLGIRIHGGKTRNGPQKSFRLYARDYLGAGEFNYQFFDTKEKTVFDKLLLRCHFGCWNKTVIKDEATAYVAKDLDFDSQHAQPCVVFINGEYWGLFSIRDFYDRQYIEEEYGFEDDSVSILNHGSGIIPGLDPEWGIYEGDNDHYVALMDFMENADMTSPESYAYITTQMDVSSMIDYYSTQVYFAQKDWPAGNHKVWRGGGDSKWRWLLFDTDSGWGYLGAANNTMIRATTTTSTNYSNPPWATFLFRKFLESPEFVEQFQSRYACLIKNEFADENVALAVDRFVNLYNPGMPRNIDRWHLVNSMSDWMNRIDDKLYGFSAARRSYTEQHISDFFDIDFNPEEYDCEGVISDLDNADAPDDVIVIYPNPATSQIWVDTNTDGVERHLKIFDGVGRLVYDQTYKYHHEINVENFSPGLYLVVLEKGQIKITSKFIKS